MSIFLNDGITYQLYNEDDILYHILSTISNLLQYNLEDTEREVQNTLSLYFLDYSR